ncbi:phosphoglycerate mutase family protein [Trematosphaeria pertusa]|uniref:Phosphoglycerate mutase family protein n=1 Tax=Trematosphaeria pertusa TaxID=390896 RepID=A0A6A6ITV8_9PLEO|nr:phosphoglycerate mutase family protein [Trematosphaeria pertusa]KAF2253608.1 phosphoglycerate mutase family protein [Trematosphaeria pertusa]
MASTIYLVRHAESEHNVSKDFSQLDPPLTTLGYAQASELVSLFPHPERIAAILSSPLRRAIQTSLAGFPHVLDKRYFDPSSDFGVENGVELTLEPDLQERSALPCDTGSERHVLEKEFLNLGLGGLREDWQAKAGQYAADDDSVTLRAARMREKLKQLDVALRGDDERKDIVVVTHGVFMKFLSGEEDIDLPKARWKSYTISNDTEDRAILTPVKECENHSL